MEKDLDKTLDAAQKELCEDGKCIVAKTVDTLRTLNQEISKVLSKDNHCEEFSEESRKTA